MPAYRAAPSYPAASIRGRRVGRQRELPRVSEVARDREVAPVSPGRCEPPSLSRRARRGGSCGPGMSCRGERRGRAPVTFMTGPSGRASCSRMAEGLDEAARDRDRPCDGSTTRALALANATGSSTCGSRWCAALPQSRTIDVAFILDTTGSMSEEIASVKSTIAKVAAGLGEGSVDVRIGLVEYKDRGDAFVTRVHPFATDVKGFAQSVAGISAGGGGDTPESVNEGIHVALTRLDWHEGFRRPLRVPRWRRPSAPRLPAGLQLRGRHEDRVASRDPDLHHRRERDGWSRPGRVAPDRAVHERREHVRPAGGRRAAVGRRWRPEVELRWDAEELHEREPRRAHPREDHAELGAIEATRCASRG